jgi:hypothetical protein
VPPVNFFKDMSKKKPSSKLLEKRLIYFRNEKEKQYIIRNYFGEPEVIYTREIKISGLLKKK